MARKLFLLLGYNANHISYGYKANEHNPRWACLPFTVKIWAPLMLDTTRAIFIRGRGDEDSGCDVKGSQHSPSLSSFKIPCILFNRVQDGLWTKGEEGQVNNRISPSLFMESLAFCEKHRRNFVNWQKERRTGWTRESPLVHYSVNWIQRHSEWVTGEDSAGNKIHHCHSSCTHPKCAELLSFVSGIKAQIFTVNSNHPGLE